MSDHVQRSIAILVLFAILLVMSILLAVQVTNDHAVSAKSAADTALRQVQQVVIRLQADDAHLRADGQALLADEVRLQQEATGSCRRVQILRADVDDAFAALHQAFGASSLYAPRHLAHLFRIYDSHVRYIPPTDCALATLHPESYRPPSPRPFSVPQKRSVLHTTR